MLIVRFQSQGNCSRLLRQAHPDPTPAEDKHLAVTAHVPPTMGSPGLFGETHLFAVITVIDHDNYRAAWELSPSFLLPSWLLRSERWQILTEGPGGEANYETFEVFSGLAAYSMRLFVGEGIQLGFRAFADSLRERVEALKGGFKRKIDSK